jgi:hypothetical protein
VSLSISNNICDDFFFIIDLWLEQIGLRILNINLVKIYASCSNSTVPTDEYFILFDGIRIENVSAINPLYSLVGYNIIKTNNGDPVLKSENTNNYLEYRFGIGVS